jgi:hypothetical protein
MQSPFHNASPVSSPRPVLFPPVAAEPGALYRVVDAADLLGIDKSCVIRLIQSRPNLFPAMIGNRHEWTASEYPGVIASLRSLSAKARRQARELREARELRAQKVH